MGQICSKCGASLPDDAVFCGNCGAVCQRDSFRGNVCRRCGKPLDGEEKFCGSCGEPVFSGGNAGQPGNQWQGNSQNSWQQPLYQNKGENTKVVALIVGCAAVIMIAAVILFLFRDSLFGNGEDMEQPVTQTAELESESIAESEESETPEESDSEEIEADIDAVRNKTSIISGKLYYTENMDTPLVILNEPLSVYADSTSGERIFMEAVSDIYLGEHRIITSDELLLYDNVEVDISGAIRIDDSKVFIDVKKIYGEPRKAEIETEEKPENDDYILPESNARFLTDADVAGLSLKEINYAKNEIYARHGRKFDSKELRDYFNSKDWYKGKIEPENFSDKVFNKYEKKNAKFLSQKEEAIQKGGYKLDQ
ncbi:YARHG domain-containing protein [Lachnospiraceae bacterium 46-15]